MLQSQILLYLLLKYQVRVIHVLFPASNNFSNFEFEDSSILPSVQAASNSENPEEETASANITSRLNSTAVTSDAVETSGSLIKSNSLTNEQETELPKSKGKLRLVPFESLLSPSCMHIVQEEGEDSLSLNRSSPRTTNENTRQQIMVAIPEGNLAELNILAPSVISKSAVSVGPSSESGRFNHCN